MLAGFQVDSKLLFINQVVSKRTKNRRQVKFAGVRRIFCSFEMVKVSETGTFFDVKCELFCTHAKLTAIVDRFLGTTICLRIVPVFGALVMIDNVLKTGTTKHLSVEKKVGLKILPL